MSSFTLVEMDNTRIFVEGIMDGPFTVVSYAQDLAAEAYTETRIVEIDEVVVGDEENTSIYYYIEVTR